MKLIWADFDPTTSPIRPSNIFSCPQIHQTNFFSFPSCFKFPSIKERKKNRESAIDAREREKTNTQHKPIRSECEKTFLVLNVTLNAEDIKNIICYFFTDKKKSLRVFYCRFRVDNVFCAEPRY